MHLAAENGWSAKEARNDIMELNNQRLRTIAALRQLKGWDKLNLAQIVKEKIQGAIMHH